MTPKERAVMQQALEALEIDEQWGFVSVKVLERRLPAITALREALAEQAEQEPVVREHELIDVRCGCCGYMTYHREHMGCIKAAPVRTKDLTDDELQPFLDEWWNLPCDTAHDVKKIFRAVIAADREKNK